MDTKTLKEIMLQQALTQSDIADILSVKQQAVGQWFSRGSIPAKYHYKLSKHFGIPINGGELVSSVIMDTQKETVDVKKILNIKVSAGNGYSTDGIDEYSDNGTIAVSKDIIGHTMDAEHIRAIQVDGKSMLPTLMPDEYVLIDISKNFYSGDGLYVLNYGGNLIVKRLQYLPINNGTLEIISDNKDFKNYTISLSDDQTTLYILGRVICQITK